MVAGCALFDLSSYAKFLVQGRNSLATLNLICANRIDVAPGRIVYTQWLNDRGGIEADGAAEEDVEVFEGDRGGVVRGERVECLQCSRTGAGVAEAGEVGVEVEGGGGRHAGKSAAEGEARRRRTTAGA